MKQRGYWVGLGREAGISNQNKHLWEQLACVLASNTSNEVGTCMEAICCKELSVAG